jgi:hypothetical protein
MKLKGTFIYLGVDTFHSNKNNQDYKSACFLQGTDVQKVFINAESEKLLHGVSVNIPVNIELDIRTGQNTFVSLLSVSPVISVPNNPIPIDSENSGNPADSAGSALTDKKKAS